MTSFIIYCLFYNLQTTINLIVFENVFKKFPSKRRFNTYIHILSYMYVEIFWLYKPATSTNNWSLQLIETISIYIILIWKHVFVKSLSTNKNWFSLCVRCNFTCRFHETWSNKIKISLWDWRRRLFLHMLYVVFLWECWFLEE